MRFLVLHLSSPVPAQTYAVERKNSVWIRGSFLDSLWSSAGAEVLGVDRRIYPNVMTLGIRLNEAAQEIIFRSVIVTWKALRSRFSKNVSNR